MKLALHHSLNLSNSESFKECISGEYMYIMTRSHKNIRSLKNIFLKINFYIWFEFSRQKSEWEMRI